MVLKLRTRSGRNEDLPGEVGQQQHVRPQGSHQSSGEPVLAERGHGVEGRVDQGMGPVLGQRHQTDLRVSALIDAAFASEPELPCTGRGVGDVQRGAVALAAAMVADESDDTETEEEIQATIEDVREELKGEERQLRKMRDDIMEWLLEAQQQESRAQEVLDLALQARPGLDDLPLDKQRDLLRAVP